ncbi:MAG: TonB-dependent receptor [Bacteroidales bacterium]|nr:TonB-dependent receptor [Bacteroidales bacterium]
MKKCSYGHIVLRGVMILVLGCLIPDKALSGSTYQQNQQRTISGTVTDEDGFPLPGATILIKGFESAGVSTGADGEYSIAVSNGDVLVVSFVGMKTKEVSITDQTNLNIVLLSDLTELSEVMVVAFGTAKRETFTGSASVVSSDKIESRPVASFTAALAANTTGVVINTSGQPGDGEVVRIRGTGSVNATLAPLYIIDGVAVNMSDLSGLSTSDSNPMATLNPSDIESITVLKDAAASSLYGSRAANGVILITTKQGKEGKTRFILDVQYGIANGLYSKPIADKDQFAELWTTGEVHRIMAQDAIFTGLDAIDYIKNTYKNPNTYDYYIKKARDNFNTAFAIDGIEYDFWGDGYDSIPDTDWYDVVSRTGGTQKINLSASGGQNGVTFFVSGEYFNQLGTIIGSNLSRFSGRVNLTSRTNKVAWFGVNMAMSYNNQDGPMQGNLYANPLRAAANIPSVVPVYIDGEPNLSLPGDILNNYNPVAIMNMNIYNAYSYRTLGTAWLQLNFTKDLFLKTTLGYDNRPYYQIRWENKDIGTGAGYNGRRQDIEVTRRRLTSSTILNFERSFNEKHNLALLAGWESEWTHTNRLGAVSTEYSSNLTPVLSAGTIPTAAYGRTYDDALLSAISRINYNFKSKYYAQFSYRADGSSRFGPNTRWGNFYSVSGSWRFSEESFMNMGWLNDGKIRASYGINGTLPGGLYEYLGNYTLGYDYYNLPGARVTNIANMGLSWEQSKNINLGFEIKILDGRIFASAEYYSRHAEDLLFDREISRTTGFTTATVNMGAMRNWGYEYSLEAYLVRASNFTWDITVNLSTLTNQITELPNDNVGTTNIDREGYAEGSLYLPEYAGVDPSTGAPTWYHINDETGERTVTFDYSEATRQIIGTREPHFSGGFYSHFAYRNFNLDMLFSYAWDYYTLDYCASRYTQTDGGQSYVNSEIVQLDNWTPNDTVAANPIRINGITNGNRFSTRHAYDGDYIKLKNIKLSYRFPVQWIRKIKLSGALIYAQVENVFVLTDMPNFDPEIRVNGYRYVYDFPSPRTYTVGIKITF